MQVGDAVIYPHHGAGKIIEQEKIERNGEVEQYFVIEMCLNQKTVKIPTNNLEEVGVRELTPRDNFYDKLEEAQQFIKENYDPEEKEHPEKIHQQTLKSLLDDVKTGDLESAIEGLQKLHTRFLDQNLNITEKRVYDTVSQFLMGELMCIEDYSRKEAEKKFNQYLPNSLEELD